MLNYELRVVAQAQLRIGNYELRVLSYKLPQATNRNSTFVTRHSISIPPRVPVVLPRSRSGGLPPSVAAH
jgi:hypothetical protein